MLTMPKGCIRTDNALSEDELVKECTGTLINYNSKGQLSRASSRGTSGPYEPHGSIISSHIVFVITHTKVLWAPNHFDP
jgi:hypothetical protein